MNYDDENFPKQKHKQKTNQKQNIYIGPILDMAWSEDSKRIIVGGEGREKYGHVFMMDGGSSVGEISGHAKPILSVDMKQTRPYRIATGGEDLVAWFEGNNFKN